MRRWKLKVYTWMCWRKIYLQGFSVFKPKNPKILAASPKMKPEDSSSLHDCSCAGHWADGDDSSHRGGGVLCATRHQQRHGGRLQPAIRGESADTGIYSGYLPHPSLCLRISSQVNILDLARWRPGEEQINCSIVSPFNTLDLLCAIAGRMARKHRRLLVHRSLGILPLLVGITFIKGHPWDFPSMKEKKWKPV